jgi:hypothetical protein
MDYFYIDARYLFKIAVMQTSREDAVIHLRAFSRRYSRQLVDTIKPDGSLFHHGFHYFAYAGGASREMAKLMELTAPTPFRVTPDAYQSVKQAFLAMRWYANLRDLPMTLHGRHPGRQQLSPDAFAVMAQAGRPYHGGELDVDMARAALRLDPKMELAGLSPEPAPTGHITMPYAGLGCHRREEWLAIVRGYGKYLAAQESYNNANRHGLFFGNGYLDILGGGKPVTIADSGCRPNDGWDWRRLDGTTVIHMPYAQMANGNGTMSERSGETFVGGVNHQGRDGLFAMSLNSAFQYRKALPKGTQSVDGGARATSFSTAASSASAPVFTTTTRRTRSRPTCSRSSLARRRPRSTSTASPGPTSPASARSTRHGSTRFSIRRTRAISSSLDRTSASPAPTRLPATVTTSAIPTATTPAPGSTTAPTPRTPATPTLPWSRPRPRD